jgi:hypothetical protein
VIGAVGYVASTMAEQTRVADHATMLAELREQVRVLESRVSELGRHL